MKDHSTYQAAPLRSSAQVTDPAGTAFSAVVLAPHQAIREMVSAARDAPPISGEPRRLFQLCDTCLATLSRHLAAVQDVLYPAVRRHLLPEGKAWVADQVHLARHIERVMRAIEGSLYGEVHEVLLSRQQMWDELVGLLDVHDRAEDEVVADAGAAAHSRPARVVRRGVRRRGPVRPDPPAPVLPARSDVGPVVAPNVVDGRPGDGRNGRPSHPARAAEAAAAENAVGAVLPGSGYGRGDRRRALEGRPRGCRRCLTNSSVTRECLIVDTE